MRVGALWPGGGADRVLAGGTEPALAAGASRQVRIPLPPRVDEGDLAVRLERWDRERADWRELARPAR